jgi:hypothetical protein
MPLAAPVMKAVRCSAMIFVSVRTFLLEPFFLLEGY